MAINRVFISGNLTRDPEIRSTSSGTPILTFCVAVNERRKNQQTGEWEDNPNYVDCTMFGTRAESVSRFISKGSKVSVEGKLRYSSWEKDGQRRSKLDVIVDEIEFMKRNDTVPAPTGPNYGPMPAPPQQVVQAPPQIQSMVNGAFNKPYPGAQDAPVPDPWDSDIPFDGGHTHE